MFPSHDQGRMIYKNNKPTPFNVVPGNGQPDKYLSKQQVVMVLQETSKPKTNSHPLLHSKGLRPEWMYGLYRMGVLVVVVFSLTCMDYYVG